MLVRLPWLRWTLVVSCLLAGSGPAAAQQWLADRDRAEGRGIRLGNFELHPGIGAEGGFDSNVFLSEDAESSAVLRIAPHLYLSTLSGERLQGERPRVTFRAGLNGSLRHYFATNAGTDMAIGQDATFAWNASSIFRLELFNSFVRNIDPFTEPAGPASGIDLNYGRDLFGVGTRLELSTPGQLVRGGLGYRFDFDYFEDDAFANNRNLSHTITADNSWEFLPKTALFWNGNLRFFEYDEDLISSVDLMDGTAALGEVGVRNNSTLVNSKIGINGALTQRIGFTVAAGYGAGFFSDDNDFENVLAQVELRWKPQENFVWALGYDRETNPAFQGNFSNMDRIKTRLQGMFAGTVVLGFDANLTFVDFGRDETLPDPERNDVHLQTSLGGEYRIVDWFAITAQVGYLQNFTDYVYELDDPSEDDAPLDGTIFDAPGGDPAILDEAKYKRFEAWLGVRAFL